MRAGSNCGTTEAKDLDRVADELAKAIDLAKDPKEAARQLARLEDAFRQRTQDEIQKKDADKPLADRLKPIARDKKAIDNAIDRLSVPPANQPGAAGQEAGAEEQAAKAGYECSSRTTPGGPPRIRWIRTKQSLEHLADHSCRRWTSVNVSRR